jgi:hypothetical protein
MKRQACRTALIAAALIAGPGMAQQTGADGPDSASQAAERTATACDALIARAAAAQPLNAQEFEDLSACVFPAPAQPGFDPKSITAYQDPNVLRGDPYGLSITGSMVDG